MAGEELRLVKADVGDGEPVVRRVHGLIDVLPRLPALIGTGEIVAEILVEQLGDPTGRRIDSQPIVGILDRRVRCPQVA